MSIFYHRYVVPVHHDTDPVWLELRLEVTVEQGVLEHVGLDRDLMTSFLACWMWARRCRRQSGRPGQCTASMLNFLLSLDGGWVMMAPMKMTDSRNRSMFRHQDGDNTFQLGVDLETEVGQHRQLSGSHSCTRCTAWPRQPGCPPSASLPHPSPWQWRRHGYICRSWSLALIKWNLKLLEELDRLLDLLLFARFLECRNKKG